MNSKKVSVVIPIYNERDNIIKLLEEVLKVIDSQAGDEIILIDDCSTDDSVKLISEYQNKSDSNIILVQHQNRSGQSASLLTGIIKASNGLIITCSFICNARASDGYLSLLFLKNRKLIVPP